MTLAGAGKKLKENPETTIRQKNRKQVKQSGRIACHEEASNVWNIQIALTP